MLAQALFAMFGYEKHHPGCEQCAMYNPSIRTPTHWCNDVYLVNCLCATDMSMIREPVYLLVFHPTQVYQHVGYVQPLVCVVRKRLIQSHLTRHGCFLTNQSTVFAGPGQVSLNQPFGVMYQPIRDEYSVQALIPNPCRVNILVALKQPYHFSRLWFSVPSQHLGGFETALPFFQAVVFGFETTLGILPQFLPGRVRWL